MNRFVCVEKQIAFFFFRLLRYQSNSFRRHCTLVFFCCCYYCCIALPQKRLLFFLFVVVVVFFFSLLLLRRKHMHCRYYRSKLLFRFLFSKILERMQRQVGNKANYMSDRSPNFSLYPGTVHLPFFTMFSTVSTIRGCAWPTSSSVRSSKGRAS